MNDDNKDTKTSDLDIVQIINQLYFYINDENISNDEKRLFVIEQLILIDNTLNKIENDMVTYSLKLIISLLLLLISQINTELGDKSLKELTDTAINIIHEYNKPENLDKLKTLEKEYDEKNEYFSDIPMSNTKH